MTDEQKILRDTAIALAVSNLKPVQFSRVQAMMAAWQMYKAARVTPLGGPGPWRPPK